MDNFLRIKKTVVNIESEQSVPGLIQRVQDLL